MIKQLILDDVKLHPHIWIGLYSDIATMILEHSSLDPIWEEQENGDLRMTEEKQDEYNQLAVEIEAIMTANGLVMEDS